MFIRMYEIMAFIYQNNKQVKDEFRKMLIDKDVTMSQVAERLDIIPQQLNNRFNNKRISLSDLQSWLNTVNCDLKITFVDRESGKEF